MIDDDPYLIDDPLEKLVNPALARRSILGGFAASVITAGTGIRLPDALAATSSTSTYTSSGAIVRGGTYSVAVMKGTNTATQTATLFNAGVAYGAIHGSAAVAGRYTRGTGNTILRAGSTIGSGTTSSNTNLSVQLLNWSEAVPTPATPVPPIAFPRPTGAGYVRYEDLRVSGDSLKQTLARCPAGVVVTFPTGNFDLTGFTDVNSSGLYIPKTCGGIWGSGPGTRAGTVGYGTDGTYFRMVAYSSTMAASATGGTVLRTEGATVAQSFGQFAVVGSAQPNAFAGFSARQGAATITLTDVTVYGHQGYANYPPGETFGVNIDWYPDHTLTRVEVDCRRADGLRYGASPLTAQHCSKGTWIDCYGHHSIAGMPTFYETSGVVTYNLKSESNGSGSGNHNGSCINHERTTGIVHHTPQLLLDRTNGNTGVHITHSNDAWITSETRCAGWTNGTLTIIDPTWTNAFGNGYLYAQTFSPEMGNPSTQTSSPTITVGGQPLHFEWFGLNGHGLT